MSGRHTRLLFRLKPERAHHLAVAAMAAAGATRPGRALVRRLFGLPEARPVTLWGLRFRNPLGLAAGWDKDARALPGLGAMGFGHVEVGTVTPRPQPGNPAPRVFRLVADEALINRMGFPGRGAEAMADRLARWRRGPGLAEDRPILGVNLGRNKDTPNERAAEDYLALVRRLGPLADYLVVNVSSPNTAGLRDLQARDALEALLAPVIAERNIVARETISSGRSSGSAPGSSGRSSGSAPGSSGRSSGSAPGSSGRKIPLLVKISPDLAPSELDATLEACLATGVDGIIATNTTLARPPLQDVAAGEAGGLSGAPLTTRADAVLADAVRLLGGRLPVIAAGGVMTPEDARRKLDLGAALVQIWTGFIYGGPSFPRRVVAALAEP